MRRIFVILFLIQVTLFAQNYKVERKLIQASRLPGENAVVKFNVFDGDRFQYSVTKKVDYDIPYPNAVVDNRGVLFIINSIFATVEVYKNGLKYNELFLLGKLSVEYERSIYFSKAQSDIILILSDPHLKGSEVYRINTSGIEMQSTLKLKAISAIKVIENEGDVIVSGTEIVNNKLNGKTLFFDSQFKVLATLPGNYDNIEFYGEKILLNSKKYVLIINYPGLTQELKFYSDDKFIYSAGIINNSPYCILYKNVVPEQGKWIFNGGVVALIDQDGNAKEITELDEFEEAKIEVGQDGKIIPILK